MANGVTMVEMSAHHVELPEQVVTPAEELWVKIIDLDLQRRRISLSIKQAAEGGVVAAEYQEAFGEHAYDEAGNFIGEFDYAAPVEGEESEAERAWRQYYEEHGEEAYRQAVAEYEDNDPAGEEAEASTDGEASVNDDAPADDDASVATEEA